MDNKAYSPPDRKDFDEVVDRIIDAADLVRYTEGEKMAINVLRLAREDLIALVYGEKEASHQGKPLTRFVNKPTLGDYTREHLDVE